MATTGTVTYTSETVGANSNEIYTGTNCPVFQMSRTDGTFPSASYRITRVRLNIQYDSFTSGNTIRLRCGDTRSEAPAGTIYASGIKVGANRTLELASSDTTNKNRWSNLNNKYLAVRGENTPISYLKTGVSFTIVVTWELTNNPATITGKSVNTVDTGGYIIFTLDPGTNVSSKSYSAVLSGHSAPAAAITPSGNNVILIVPTDWNAYISGATASATFTVTSTFSDSTQQSNSTTFTVHVPDNVKPTDVSISKTINPNNSISGTPTLQNVSTVSLTGSATAAAGAATLTYTWTMTDGQTGTGSSWTSAAFRSSGTVTITLRVTDSRGRYTEATDTIPVTAYSPPAVSAASSANRCLSDGTKADTEGTFAMVYPVYTWTEVSDNTKTVTIQWRYTGDPDFPADNTFTGSTSSGGYQMIGTNIPDGETFNVQKAYKIRVTVSDSIGNSSYTEIDIDKAAAFMVWDGTQPAIGFGCHPSAANTVEIDQNWDVVRNGLGAFNELENISDTLSDLTSAIGTYYSNTNSSGTNMSNYANVTICSITNLPAGTYMAEGTILYPGNANGYRVACLSTNSSQTYNYGYDGISEIGARDTNYVTLHTSLVFKLSGTGGIYLRGYHNAGTTLNSVKGTLHCVRIK